MVTFALVLHVIVYFVSVVEIAVPPVAVHSAAPELLLRKTLALGNRVPTFAVFRIHSWIANVEPLGMTPATPGTPACVSNSLISFSPLDVLLRLAVWSATLAMSGPDVFSWLKLAVLDASLCR
jgi:hypothetical protein